MPCDETETEKGERMCLKDIDRGIVSIDRAELVALVVDEAKHLAGVCVVIDTDGDFATEEFLDENQHVHVIRTTALGELMAALVSLEKEREISAVVVSTVGREEQALVFKQMYRTSIFLSSPVFCRALPLRSENKKYVTRSLTLSGNKVREAKKKPALLQTPP
ncbi:MAG: uncharacterized protein A8A55_0100 [Amphiamblys sp. WSBS2006]|nr:MAG: uncharacterized protein A8A55_0100 [Amphiamblys sp. WSBS2006]